MCLRDKKVVRKSHHTAAVWPALVYCLYVYVHTTKVVWFNCSVLWVIWTVLAASYGGIGQTPCSSPCSFEDYLVFCRKNVIHRHVKLSLLWQKKMFVCFFFYHENCVLASNAPKCIWWPDSLEELTALLQAPWLDEGKGQRWNGTGKD